MDIIFNEYASYVTNGKIYCRIIGMRYSCGINPPDGVIFGQDNAGNMYLNGEKAWVEVRKVSEVE